MYCIKDHPRVFFSRFKREEQEIFIIKYNWKLEIKLHFAWEEIGVRSVIIIRIIFIQIIQIMSRKLSFRGNETLTCASCAIKIPLDWNVS